jgi:subtilisin family serine protease
VAAENVATPALVSQVLASPPYSGVAPGALIVPVKLKDGNDDSILDGVNYVAEKARQLGRPFVINDSFGQVLGSHDGTEPLELAFADLAADGVPITVAAGNYRNANLHVSGTLSPGQTVAVSWSSGKAPQQQAIDLWYDVSDDIGITIRTPTGTNVTGPTPDTGVATTDGNVIVTRDSRATGKEWWINITSSNPLRWQFILSGITIEDGRWDAWGEPGQFLPPTGSVTGGYRIDESDTIAYPGNSRGTITVGAYVNKSLWRSGCSSCINFTSSVVSPFTGRVGIRGIWNDKNQTGMAGDITSDSGMGPTRDGRTKPEIVAPGANIAMARAANAREKNSNPDNFHQVLSGTSFSAPHVAGVIALMLQMNHYLSPDEIRTILTEDARQDKFTGIIGANGSPLWGWGKVNALNSTLGALSLYSVRVEIIPVGVPIVVNVSLDGQNIRLISLNESLPIIFEFKEGENHTVTLSQMIQDGPGTRYALVEGPWTFTAGGVRRFHYQLQYFLNVKSDFGFPTGTGWYDANSTAVASVAPPAAQGYEFQGWIGSVISNSPTLEIRMDSSKEVEAVWSRTYTLPSVGSPLSLNNIIGIILAIAISVAVAIFIRYKFPRTRNNGAARSYEVLPRPPV